jgi:hypothetical protein
LSTRLGTALRPRGPVGTNTFRHLFAFPRPVRQNSTRQAAGAILRSGLANTFGRGGFSAPVFSRGAFTPLTRQGTRLFPRGQLYTNTVRSAIPSTIVTLPTGHWTLTPKAFTILQDTVVEFPSASDISFTAGATFTVLQGGSVVDLPTGHWTITPGGFQVVQTNSGDRTVFLPTGHWTLTPKNFTVVYENSVSLPTGHMTFSGIPFDISITLPGQQTLTQTDILAIWNNISISGLTPANALSVIASAVAGRTVGALDATKGSMVFRSIDNSKDVIHVAYDETGNRLVVTLTP